MSTESGSVTNTDDLLLELQILLQDLFNDLGGQYSATDANQQNLRLGTKESGTHSGW